MLHLSWHLMILKKEIVFHFVIWISFIARDGLVMLVHFPEGLYENGFRDEVQWGVRIFITRPISRAFYHLQRINSSQKGVSVGCVDEVFSLRAPSSIMEIKFNDHGCRICSGPGKVLMLHSFPVGPQPGLSPSMRLEMSLSGVLPASQPKAALVNTIGNEHQCVVNKCCVALLPTLRLPRRKVKACTKASTDHNVTTTPFSMANSFGSVLKFPAGFTQAQNCTLSSLDLEINTLTAISKSFSG